MNEVIGISFRLNSQSLFKIVEQLTRFKEEIFDLMRLPSSLSFWHFRISLFRMILEPKGALIDLKVIGSFESDVVFLWREMLATPNLIKKRSLQSVEAPTRHSILQNSVRSNLYNKICNFKFIPGRQRNTEYQLLF